MSIWTRRVVGMVLALAITAGSTGALARELSAHPINDLYVFGDSLSDSGNLFSATGVEPPSPPYFKGRFSDGPIWVENLALLLDLAIDFDIKVTDDPLANVQAFGGALSGFGSEFGDPIGLLSQVENFTTAGGRFARNDLIIIWVGANDYLLIDNTKPLEVVRNITKAIRQLSNAGGRRFLIVNLPNLGDTPLGLAAGTVELLNLATASHNRLLHTKVAFLRLFSRLEVALFDVNASFKQVIDNPEVFGFSNVTTPCLILLPDGTRKQSGACRRDQDSRFDSTGTLFWDLIHPSANGHRNIAIAAHSTLVALQKHALQLPGWTSHWHNKDRVDDQSDDDFQSRKPDRAAFFYNKTSTAGVLRWSGAED